MHAMAEMKAKAPYITMREAVAAMAKRPEAAALNALGIVMGAREVRKVKLALPKTWLRKYPGGSRPRLRPALVNDIGRLGVGAGGESLASDWVRAGASAAGDGGCGEGDFGGSETGESGAAGFLLPLEVGSCVVEGVAVGAGDDAGA